MKEASSAVAVARRLSEISDTMRLLLIENAADNFDEILPHMYMSDVAIHLVALYEKAKAGDAASWRELNSVLSGLGREFRDGDESVQELIHVSLIENVMSTPIVDLLEKDLKAEADQIANWKPRRL